MSKSHIRHTLLPPDSSAASSTGLAFFPTQIKRVMGKEIQLDYHLSLERFRFKSLYHLNRIEVIGLPTLTEPQSKELGLRYGPAKSLHSNANNNKASKIYSKAEVFLHNKRTDCWIIIKNKVYDVTSYVEEHPGGDAILAHAGDDSTEGFYGPQHATRVFDMIDDFYVGDLEQ
ncbi:hypothetical protein Q3G72_028487 [Acer saccharum]|nr:hypothetical protein Q3G72_028487 [Acer saccharum]